MLPVTAFLSYVIVSSLSPGPNTLLSMSYASKDGMKKTLPFNLGIAIGVFVVTLLCSIFSFALVRLFPSFQSIMIWIGAGYILWMAWKTLHSNSTEAQPTNTPNRNLLIQGAFLQFVNPNTILYGITVFATFITPYYQSPMTLALFSLLLSIIAFLSTACWTVLGSAFQAILISHRKIINWIMALLLLYCAVSLVF